MGEPENISFITEAKNCLSVIAEMERESAPILNRIKTNDLGTDFIKTVKVFINDFDKVKESFDKLSIKDGAPTQKLTEKEQKEASELIPKLVAGLERLAEGHALIIATFKRCIAANSEKMDIMRNAKKIFNKFVKAKQQDPKFIDKRM